jgi:hypothetical protein
MGWNSERSSPTSAYRVYDATRHWCIRPATMLRNTTAVLPWMLCAATLLAPGPTRAGGALPTNGQYVAGQGSIASSANGVTINQSSSHGIINWQGFSIGQGNSVLVWTIDPNDMPTLSNAP